MVGIHRFLTTEPVPLFGAKSGVKTRLKNTPPIQTIQPTLFAPRPERPSLKRFAVLGDPGSGTVHQRKMADELWQAYQKQPFDTVFTMGDNCYEEGHPSQFHKKIYAPYKKLFDAGVKFFPLMGNHDVRSGHADKQLAFFGAPNFYNVKLGNDLECFVLDTTMLLPGYEKCYTQNKAFAEKGAEIQLKWLEKALADSTAKNKIVLGHYPMYSSGDVSDDDDWQEKLDADGVAYQKMRTMLEPMLLKNGVDLYLTAHEHHYETSHDIKGMHHILTGGSGKLGNVLHEDTPTYPRKKLISHRYHVMVFEQTDKGLEYQTIGKQGKILDTGLVPSKAPVRFSKLA